MQYLKNNSYFFSLKVHIKQISSILSYMYKRKPQKGFFKWILIQKDFIAIWKLLNDALIVVWKVTTEHIMFVFFSEKEGQVKCCDLCLQRNLRKKQTHFCKTKSEVPKALCKDCAHQHTRKKVSRYHEVCKSPGGFPSFQR